jgi:hypothetical protein
VREGCLHNVHTLFKIGICTNVSLEGTRYAVYSGF